MKSDRHIEDLGGSLWYITDAWASKWKSDRLVFVVSDRGSHLDVIVYYNSIGGSGSYTDPLYPRTELAFYFKRIDHDS